MNIQCYALVVAVPLDCCWPVWNEMLRGRNCTRQVLRLELDMINRLSLLHPVGTFADSITTQIVKLFPASGSFMAKDEQLFTQLAIEDYNQLLWLIDPDSGDKAIKVKGPNGRSVVFSRGSAASIRWPGRGGHCISAYSYDSSRTASQSTGTNTRMKDLTGWVNPVVLPIKNMDHKGVGDATIPNPLNGVVEVLLDPYLSESQIVPCWDTHEPWRYYARRLLWQLLRDVDTQSQSRRPRSLLGRLFLSGDEFHDDFELLDRLGGTFCVRGFGSGDTEITLQLQQESLLPEPFTKWLEQASGIKICVAPGANFAKPLLPPPRPWEPALDLGRSLEEACTNALTEMENDSFAGLQQAIALICNLVAGLGEEKEVADGLYSRLCKETPQGVGAFGFLDQLCRLCWAPRSPVLVEFPGEGCLAGRLKDCPQYRAFQEGNAFDPAFSPLRGGLSFLLRLLRSCESDSQAVSTDADHERPTIIVFQHLWWYDWERAAWTQDDRFKLTLRAEDDRRKLGAMKLGDGKLGPTGRQLYSQTQHIWFSELMLSGSNF